MCRWALPPVIRQQKQNERLTGPTKDRRPCPVKRNFMLYCNGGILSTAAVLTFLRSSKNIERRGQGRKHLANAGAKRTQGKKDHWELTRRSERIDFTFFASPTTTKRKSQRREDNCRVRLASRRGVSKVFTSGCFVMVAKSDEILPEFVNFGNLWKFQSYFYEKSVFKGEK
jgi:hypothetical protein